MRSVNQDSVSLVTGLFIEGILHFQSKQRFSLLSARAYLHYDQNSQELDLSALDICLT